MNNKPSVWEVPGPPEVSSPATAAVLVIFAAGFGILALERTWFNDDAFITFRYARHMAEGLGFVWNSVDPVRVEGSTSPT